MTMEAFSWFAEHFHHTPKVLPFSVQILENLAHKIAKYLLYMIKNILLSVSVWNWTIKNWQKDNEIVLWVLGFLTIFEDSGYKGASVCHCYNRSHTSTALCCVISNGVSLSAAHNSHFTSASLSVSYICLKEEVNYRSGLIERVPCGRGRGMRSSNEAYISHSLIMV